MAGQAGLPGTVRKAKEEWQRQGNGQAGSEQGNRQCVRGHLSNWYEDSRSEVGRGCGSQQVNMKKSQQRTAKHVTYFHCQP